jgi:hypothetical protein
MTPTRIVAICFAAACCCFVAASQTAFSQQIARPRGSRQYRGVASEPYVSPYLNLARPGTDPGFNYYTLVQPQLQQQQFNQQQNRRTQALQRQVYQQQAEIMTPYGAVGGIRPTGRAATFMNYSHYYPGLGAGPSAGGRRYTSSLGGGGMGMGMGMSMGGMGGMGGFGGGY